MIEHWKGFKNFLFEISTMAQEANINIVMGVVVRKKL